MPPVEWNQHAVPGHLLGQRHQVPPTARHARHGRIRRQVLLLGQGLAHQIENVGTDGAVHHGLLFQSRRPNLRLLGQLRLVKGPRIQQSAEKELHLSAFLHGGNLFCLL